MSRRRSDPPLRFPASRAVFAAIVDPGGHRLVRIGRSFDEKDPDRWFYEGDSIPETVSMFEAIARYHELYPEWWSFACKGCRDQGKPYLSRLTYAEISDLMHGLWLRAEAADFNTPVKAEIRSTAIALD